MAHCLKWALLDTVDDTALLLTHKVQLPKLYRSVSAAKHSHQIQADLRDLQAQYNG